MSVKCPETVDPVVCPKCGHKGIADASHHVFFVENMIGLRCRNCSHIWKAISAPNVICDGSDIDRYRARIERAALQGYAESMGGSN